MGKNKKAFVPPLKAKRRKNVLANTSLMDKPSSVDLLVGSPNMVKAKTNVSSSLIINVVSNSDDTIKELVSGPTTAGQATIEPTLGEHDGFFLRDESQSQPDIYEFHSSP